MVKNGLLRKVFQRYNSAYGVDLRPVQSNALYLDNLFNRYKNWGYAKHSFCCNGEEQECWIDPFEEGICGFNLRKLKSMIRELTEKINDTINDSEETRLFLHKDDNRCNIYIYARDMPIKADFHIFFNNDELSEVK